MRLMPFIRRILFGWKTAGIFLIAIAAFCNVASIANATTLTFGEGQTTIPGCYVVSPFLTYCGAKQYVEKGMTVNAGSANIFEVTDISESFSFATGTSLNLWTTDGPGPNTATFSMGGALFDVISADFSPFFGSLSSSNGGFIREPVSLFPPFPPPLFTLPLDFTQFTGWTGITSFTMSVGGMGTCGDCNFGIDNLVIRVASVPEPSTLVLLMLGLAGLIGWRRASPFE